MNTIKTTSIAGLLSIASLSAFEGGYDYKDMLKNGGTFYSDKSNPIIQKAKFYGRVQFQAAAVDGDNSDGTNNYTELRRTRLGAEVKFLNYFKFKGNANLENGVANDVEFGGFTGWDDAGISVNLAKAFSLDGFDKLDLTVGKKKIKMGDDVRTSSKKIKTVERSAVTGRLRPDNSSGVILNSKINGISFDLGLFSNSNDDEFSFWDHSNGSFIYASTGFKAGSGQVYIDATYATEDAEEISGGAMANGSHAAFGLSVSYAQEFDFANVVVNAFYGDNGDLSNEDRSGAFYGASILAYTEIVENLELVGRAYYWASEEAEGVRVNSRYARSSSGVDSAPLSNSGRGDSHASVYAGLNYYFAGDNAKLMAGVEYETLSTPDGDESATTLWGAYRMYF